jgi:hypothetical protein
MVALMLTLAWRYTMGSRWRWNYKREMVDCQWFSFSFYNALQQAHVRLAHQWKTLLLHLLVVMSSYPLWLCIIRILSAGLQYIKQRQAIRLIVSWHLWPSTDIKHTPQRASKDCVLTDWSLQEYYTAHLHGGVSVYTSTIEKDELDIRSWSTDSTVMIRHFPSIQSLWKHL